MSMIRQVAVLLENRDLRIILVQVLEYFLAFYNKNNLWTIAFFKLPSSNIIKLKYRYII
jgi:hypothetical protein